MVESVKFDLLQVTKYFKYWYFIMEQLLVAQRKQTIDESL